jgi:hypothetical protein
MPRPLNAQNGEETEAELVLTGDIASNGSFRAKRGEERPETDS